MFIFVGVFVHMLVHFLDSFPLRLLCVFKWTLTLISANFSNASSRQWSPSAIATAAWTTSLSSTIPYQAQIRRRERRKRPAPASSTPLSTLRRPTSCTRVNNGLLYEPRQVSNSSNNNKTAVTGTGRTCCRSENNQRDTNAQTLHLPLFYNYVNYGSINVLHTWTTSCWL